MELNLRKKRYLCVVRTVLLRATYLLILVLSGDQWMPYDNFLDIGDLNSEISEMVMSEFYDTYNLQNLVKDPTCYKNPSKPTCIDLILTNFPKSFQHN